MSDHLNYCNTIANLSDKISTDCNNGCESASIDIEEKSGDELLIELYRERPFLYDKNNTSFKDCLMKQNAWIEISKIMTQINGDIYTPSYCQKRCISLRDQYSREKRKAETELKNGSAAAKSTRFTFFSQLAFLDHVIKRRRRYTNCAKFHSSIIVDEDSTYESQSATNESSNEENENVYKQHVHNIKNVKKENELPKLKKRKVNETRELEQTLVQMNHRISNYMETKVSTADDAFMEFIKVQFKNIPEQEKNIRRKMIMDVLTLPLEKLHQKDCKCNTLFKKLLINTFSH
ncbi:uncharacterized protein LOC105257020 isoform X1 [Camponotus floridanus]|uniref:uncharacterized protein LOC105257020 isoform X1 n=1 Tax=Camponotus floridanus TaxID=104421 RepID=UPI000DC68F52|nr:uncharacterized protein LOC105257020 isoform X1 [Camponotus floridanus]